MTAWMPVQLDRIGRADELRVASFRGDGSLRSPRIVWVVRHGDDLFIRSVNGPGAAWYRGTRDRHEGRIWAGGVEADVTFADMGHQLDAELDAAYRSKYRNHAAGDVDAINSAQAQEATLRLDPR
jgi:hypothetical protein